MGMRGENVRFWLPVALLVAFAANSSTMLIRAHVDPSVDDLDYTFTKDLPGCRGKIFDSLDSEFPLVKSVPVWEYRLDPVALTNRVFQKKGEAPRTRDEIVKTIADALGLDFQAVRKMSLDTHRRYQYLSTSSDPESHRILRDSRRVPGVVIVDKQVRQYFHGRRLSHVLGSVNAENTGSAGIELKYNGDLSGVPGKVRGIKNALGHEIYDKRIEDIPPIPGADVYLTVDRNIQYEAESWLKKGVEEYHAGSGWCVVMDSRTGAVLAMASLPDFDPIAYGRSSEESRLNRATNLTYEPGSVMKVITAAAAIDANMATPQTRYSTNRNDDRYFRLPGDSHAMEPTMTLKDAIVHSSNVVMGKVGCDLGPKRLWEYMSKFGFGKRTGIELPGEESGILPHWSRWDKVKWSRAPIGQGVAVTAVQICSAYQAIANDGVRMQPYIVDRVVSHDGQVFARHSPKSLGRVVSAETARQVRDMMLGVASPAGTARRAALRGYSVAGKTGTAQKVVNGHYSDTLFRATFCGIVPASAPRLVILVTLDFDTHEKFHQGGNSAGPVFRNVAMSALRYLMVAPDRPDELADGEEEDEFDRMVDERAQGHSAAAE